MSQVAAASCRFLAGDGSSLRGTPFRAFDASMFVKRVKVDVAGRW